MKKIALFGKFSEGMRNALYLKCPTSFEVYEVESGHLERLSQADYIVCRAVSMDQTTFDTIKNTKLIQKWGTGYDNIDIQAAGRHGFPVAVCVGGNSIPVAELTVTLMLDVLRNVIPMATRLKAGEWARDQFSARSYLLHHKTVGLIGIGSIAKKVSSILRGGFDCQILYYDIFRMSEEEERALGVTYAELDTLMAQSDVVSIHVPLLDSTMGMLDKSKLKLMKKTACLINTSRGPIVNEPDLIEFLREGKILGAGLDTFAQEPLPMDSELLTLDCVVTTPHCGGNTVDNDINMATICMDNIARYDATGDNTMCGIVNQKFLS